MSPLFMDTLHEPNSPSSVSAEESNTAGSDREGEGQQRGNRGRKRQDKNRDAARKSRRKQTERADELHEELQCLEQSNSAFKKEIAALKKDLHFYTTALEHHEPFCLLKASDSSLSVSPSADCPPLASSSTFSAAPSLSTSLTSGLGLQTRDCVDSTRLSSSTPPTTLTSPAAELFTSSFSAAPHSLFSKDPPSLIASMPTNVPPVCASLVSSPAPSSSLAAAAQQGSILESSSANARFSPLHSGALDTFLMKQASFLTAPSNVVPLFSHSASENADLEGCPMNGLQLNPGPFSRNPINSSPPCSLLPPTLHDPALLPPSAFTLKPNYSQQLNPVSLLSLLTVPSPLNMSQTTSSGFAGPLSQPPPSLPPLGDASRDLSLSELLEVNDWILSGTSHQ